MLGFSTGPRSKSTTSTWNSSPQRELATNPLSGKLGADQWETPENRLEITAATCAAQVGGAATIRDGSGNAASAGWSCHSEHPGVGVRVAETFIDEVCE